MASRNRWLEYKGKRVAAARKVTKRLARRELRRNDGKGSSVPRKKDEDATARSRVIRPTREEESQWSSVEDKRKWCIAFEDAARRLLRYLEDSEDLLKELQETPAEAGFLSCRLPNSQGMREAKSSSRQGENEVYIASLARWDTQLKGLVELERRCLDLMQACNC